jgi:EpsI family protein
MLVAAAVTLLGPKVAVALAFPLGYMAFLVPFGDELIPLMQLVTAKLTIALVQLSGVRASIDGVFIDTPAGLFEVAEACSGVKFLIAMAAFGVLVANVCFRSWSRRIAFLFLALALPIFANGLRAWGTVFAAQYVGADKASGIDHLVYGWIFFALVMGATLAMGWRFFDRAPDDAMVDAAAIERSPLLARLQRLRIGAVAAGLAMAALALLFIAWAGAAERLRAPLPGTIALPAVSGWQQVEYRPAAPWSPRATGADRRVLARYRDRAGREVDVFVALYAAQDEGREAGGFGEGALTPDSGWAWLAPGSAVPEAKSDRLLGPGGVERLAETRYRTGALLTGSNLRLKLANIHDRLRLRARPTMMLILSAEQRRGSDPAAWLRAFRASAGPLEPWMDRIAGVG